MDAIFQASLIPQLEGRPVASTVEEVEAARPGAYELISMTDAVKEKVRERPCDRRGVTWS